MPNRPHYERLIEEFSRKHSTSRSPLTGRFNITSLTNVEDADIGDSQDTVSQIGFVSNVRYNMTKLKIFDFDSTLCKSMVCLDLVPVWVVYVLSQPLLTTPTTTAHVHSPLTSSITSSQPWFMEFRVIWATYIRSWMVYRSKNSRSPRYPIASRFGMVWSRCGQRCIVGNARSVNYPYSATHWEEKDIIWWSSCRDLYEFETTCDAVRYVRGYHCFLYTM